MADEPNEAKSKKRPEETIAALIRSRNDTAGNAILEFFACNPPDYAVYRTNTRVLIEFADDDETERGQRTRLARLGPLRSEINGLINGWRISHEHRLLAKARVYDRRTADALVMALENDVDNAELELNRVRNAIIDARTSVARFLYLMVAFGVAVFLCLAVGLMSLPAMGMDARWEQFGDVLTAVVGGTGGAFFSIATGLSKRTILTDLQQRDNALDAILRMVIGVLSAAILICLLRSNLGVTLAASQSGWMPIVTLGFLAGFSERMVPDLLEKAGMAVKITPLPAPPPLPQPARQVPPPPSPSPSPPPPPAPAPAPSPPLHEGDCACDDPVAAADAVPDAALPAASGGVEKGEGR